MPARPFSRVGEISTLSLPDRNFEPSDIAKASRSESPVNGAECAAKCERSLVMLGGLTWRVVRLDERFAGQKGELREQPYQRRCGSPGRLTGLLALGFDTLVATVRSLRSPPLPRDLLC